MTVHTEVLTDPAQIRALIPEWDALALRDPRTTPYDCGSVMIGLGEIFEGGGIPYLVVARTDSGALAAVLPLRRVPGGGRLGGHRLIAYPTWHASYFDASVEPDSPACRDALLSALTLRRDWDHCDLQYLRPDGNLLHADTPGWQEVVGTSRFIAHADLATAPAGGVLGHKAARRLAKAGQVEFTAALSGNALPTELRRFAEMHTRRWAGHGEAAEFADSRTVDRLVRVMGALVEAGIARVGCLRLSGVTIAVHLAFRWRTVQYSWRMSHDAEWQAMSPGRLLMSLMIEDALTSGCQQYDLGRGAEGYKQLWTTTERPLYRLSIAGSSWRARLATLRTRR